MKISKIYAGLEKITPEGWELGFYRGVYFFKKEVDNRIMVISITYSDYEPKFAFNSLGTRVKYLDVENILEPLKIKYFNHDSREDIFSSTVKQGSRFTDKYRYDGITTMDELEGFLSEIQSKIDNLALPFLQENDSIEKISDTIKSISEAGEKITPYLGQYAIYRRLIIAFLLGEKTEFKRLKEKKIEELRHLVDVEKKDKLIPYLKMYEELVTTLENKAPK